MFPIIRNAYISVYCDGNPSDWFISKENENWHTIIFLVILQNDQLDSSFEVITNNLPCKFRKINDLNRSNRKEYKKALLKSICNNWNMKNAWINSVSFTENSIRSAQEFLFQQWGIGFEKRNDENGRTIFKHEFVNFYGYHTIDRLETQTLPLLVWSWLICKQYMFYKDKTITDGKFDGLNMDVFPDKLSGDTRMLKFNETALQDLVNYDCDFNIKISSSVKDKTSNEMLLVDNISGLLNEILSNPNGYLTNTIENINTLIEITGWKELFFDGKNLCIMSMNRHFNL